MIISFSGLDGAGKSTQITLLKDFFEAKGQRVCVVVMYDDVSTARLVRDLFKGKKNKLSEKSVVEKQSADSFRLDKNYFSWPRFLFRMLVYFADALRLWQISLFRRKDCDVVIFDRYIYDSLVNLLSQVDSWWVRVYVKAILFLSPEVDLAVFLSASPKEAFERKQEYPLDYMEKRYEGYVKLFTDFIPNGIVANGNIDEVFSKIKEKIDGCEKR